MKTLAISLLLLAAVFRLMRCDESSINQTLITKRKDGIQTHAGVFATKVCRPPVFFRVIFSVIKSAFYKVPRNSCSRSMASKSALKFPFPNDRAPFRWMISKNRVGRGSTGFVKIWSK